MNERACIKEFEVNGLPVPTRFLVRASTGNTHGFYGIAYFTTVKDALTVKAMTTMQWSDGTSGPIRLLNSCASNTCVCFVVGVWGRKCDKGECPNL